MPISYNYSLKFTNQPNLDAIPGPSFSGGTRDYSLIPYNWKPVGNTSGTKLAALNSHTDDSGRTDYSISDLIDYNIYLSDDGGNTWRRSPPPGRWQLGTRGAGAGATTLTSIACSDNRRVIVVCSEKDVWISKNSGDTWTKVMVSDSTYCPTCVTAPGLKSTLTNPVQRFTSVACSGNGPVLSRYNCSVVAATIDKK